jgi:histidine phosphotransferase ChpT
LTTVPLAPLDLAALLSSRICHDVISPVGAIVNGLEVLEGEEDADMRSVAMDLIKKSAISASARLQFCRLAFGAAGSLGASVDTGDAENVVRGLFANDRTTLRWNPQRQLAPKNVVKLLLNLCLIAAGAAPRGGIITVDLGGEDAPGIKVEAMGANVRLSHAAAGFLSGAPIETIDAHSIQPYYATLLARECGMTIKATTRPDAVTLTALPATEGGAFAEPQASENRAPGQAETAHLANPAVL